MANEVSDIALNATGISETSPVGTAVGALSAAAVDPAGLKYSIAGDPDGKFGIVTEAGVTKLVLTAALDAKAKASHAVDVTVTDTAGSSRTQTFTIGVEARSEITIDAGKLGGVDFPGWIAAYYNAMAKAANGTPVSGTSAFHGGLADGRFGFFNGDQVTFRFKEGTSASFTHVVSLDGADFSYDSIHLPQQFPVAHGYISGTIDSLTFATLGATLPADGATLFADYAALLKVSGFGIDTAPGAGGGSASTNPVPALYYAAQKGQAEAIEAVLGRFDQKFVGSAGSDRFTGAGFNDSFVGSGGTDAFDGGAGEDTLVLTGARANYDVTANGDGSLTVRDLRAGGDGTVTLRGAEKIRFTDAVVAVDRAPGRGADAAPSLAIELRDVDEDAPVGTVVGTLAAADPEGYPVALSLAGDAAAFFEIVGTELRVKARLNHELAASHKIEVTATDAGGGKTAASATLAVGDVYEGARQGSITIDASGAGGIDLEATLRGGVLQGTTGGGFPSFDNGPGLSGREMFIGYGTGADAKYVLMRGEIGYGFATHTVGGTAEVVEYGRRGTGTFGADGAFSGGQVELRISGLALANAFPADPADEPGIEAVGPIHNFTVAHMAGAAGNPARLDVYATALDAYAQHFIGSAGADVYAGTGFNDVIESRGGNDLFDGNAGTDTLRLAGQSADWILAESGGGWTLTRGADTVSVTDTEYAAFDDRRFDFAAEAWVAPDAAPVLLALSGAAVAENAPAGTLVGTLAGEDPEGGEITWSLAEGSSADFEIVGEQLRTRTAFDHEASPIRAVTVVATDATGAATEKTFTIKVADADEAPHTLALSKAAVAENSKAGATVGVLSAVDPEGKALTWKLTDDAGGLFKLSGGRLQLARTADHEALASASAAVEATDAGGKKAGATFAVAISDVDEAPAALTLTGSRVAENSRPGALVGVLSAADPEGGAVTWKLKDSAGGVFKLAGDRLLVAKGIDYEKNQSFDVVVEARDAAGHRTAQSFTVAVADVTERVTGDARANVIKGDIGSDALWGGDGADTLWGYAGRDRLSGDRGDDVLRGGLGNDILIGGAGADSLYGGRGADTFRFALAHSTADAAGRDTIFDFAGAAGDRIDLRAVDANGSGAGAPGFAFIGAAEFSGKAGELRAVTGSSDAFLHGDTDGDRTADFAIHFDDAATIGRDWLLL